MDGIRHCVESDRFRCKAVQVAPAEIGERGASLNRASSRLAGHSELLDAREKSTCMVLPLHQAATITPDPHRRGGRHHLEPRPAASTRRGTGEGAIELQHGAHGLV
jgi:hypothetical protein